ncbi:MAG: cupin domain-containing protein, partial [Pseudomonadales bacterium]
TPSAGLLLLFVFGCSEPPSAPLDNHRLSASALPAESYKRGPAATPDENSYVYGLKNLSSFYDHPGELGYFMRGQHYGFDSLSIIVTETHPDGGPPLHVHEIEEAHIVLAGTMNYVMDKERFTATAPFIARVPAGVPHTFVNGGSTPLNLIAVFPTDNHTTEFLGPNPLIEEDE